ncbi:MAG: hypothetical protein PVH84_18030, partial [Candidatus Aminicenantes bacterium]
MAKKITLLLFCVLFTLCALLRSQEKKVTVIADKAPIYAEASDKSHRIESVKKGTVLSLFVQEKKDTEWLYITFYSNRYKGKATGFIRSSLVVYGEELPEEQTVEEAKPGEDVSQPRRDKEKEPQELPSLEEAFAPKKAEEIEVERKKPEEPQEVLVEEKPDTTPPEADVPEKPEVELKPEIITTTKLADVDVPESRKISEPEFEKSEESTVYAMVQREFPPPPDRDIKPEAVVQEEKPLEEEPYKVEVEEPKPVQEPERETEPKTVQVPITETVQEPESETGQKPEAKTVPETEVEIVPEAFPETKPETAPETEKKAAEASEEEAPPPLAKAEEAKEAIEPQKPSLPEIESPEEAKETATEKEEVKKEAAEKAEPEEDTQVIKPPAQEFPPKDIIALPTPAPKRSLLTMGFGYGPSLGGLGTFLQLNTTSGFAIHAGVGYYPATAYYSQYDWLKNEVLYSAGIKYYLPFGDHRW